MPVLETEIAIDAPPHLVWSVLDDLEHYPEWNEILPDIKGRTTVGGKVSGTLKQENTPDIPVNPTITRIVGARELRWLSQAPGGVFTAEHIFILQPLADGRTRLIHNEVFGGPVATERWPGIDTNTRKAYNKLNEALKKRAESYLHADVCLHPAVGKAASGEFSTAKLHCRCGSEPVELIVSEPVSHNHLCGCSKCWKPEGATFAQIAVVPAGSVTETANAQKLESVDPSQKIERFRCKECGTHMVGRVSDPDHHFYGLEFVHPELMDSDAQPQVEFAAFVSSLIETGTSPSLMTSARKQLSASGIPAYDAFSPELMDIIAWHRVKLAKAG